MDIEEYVNEPVNERRNISANRKNSRSGLFKVILVVGISFCLLCIIQAVLNVTLRLHGDGFCNKTHTTDVSPVLQDENDGVSGEKNQNCDQDWTQYMSSCYQLSAKKDSWWNAKDDCMVNGANLVIIDNEKEENALQNAFGDLAVWIGLKAEKTQESFLNWKWVDGRQLTYG
ncbi:Early activation antigen CD69 [Larimichthys crocea]|nr:Early activation antigen CD69 [Larimichthys crocea]